MLGAHDDHYTTETGLKSSDQIELYNPQVRAPSMILNNTKEILKEAWFVVNIDYQVFLSLFNNKQPIRFK